jgi:hypothetical protein
VPVSYATISTAYLAVYLSRYLDVAPTHTQPKGAPVHIPASPHFQTVSLAPIYNARRTDLPESLAPPLDIADRSGPQTFHGIPFDLGAPGTQNDAQDVVLLDPNDSNRAAVSLELNGIRATYILFLHVADDKASVYQPGLADSAYDGNELGQAVSDYTLHYGDSTQDGEEIHVVPILRRFAIQQGRIGWGASAFAAVPYKSPYVTRTVTEDMHLGRMPQGQYGRGETRHGSGRDGGQGLLWIYAFPNPHPERPIARVTCMAREERSAIYAVTTTQLADHPLRPGVREKLLLRLPPGAQLNGLGELDEIGIDLGTVISTRAMLDYDRARWASAEPVVLPTPREDAVVVEYSAHPAARLYVGTGEDRHTVYTLAELPRLSESSDAAASEQPPALAIAPARRLVRVRVVEKETNQPVPVRIHFHGQAGEYLPPRGNHRKVNGYWFEDNYGEFVNVHNQYAYIHGECEVDLPLGQVFVEITRGYEVTPIRDAFTVAPDTDEVTFTVEKTLKWREAGWVTADTHVHFLSPQTALLEGQAEGVNVVNLLASQWGEMFSNVTDFDGKTTLGAKEFGGDGEFLVRVGTENRMQTLGHISLLGYAGQMIHPLCTGGPSESAIGDPQEVTMAEWAQRCIDQGGLVVMPHAPNPQLERAADFVLGVVHAVEMMTFNPLNPSYTQISPYGVADWYRYLNLGYQIPVVGGSDKMAASSLLGGVRTYAHLGDRAFTYENWMQAVQAGNTFVTVGPLARMTAEGVAPGSQVRLSGNGGKVAVEWTVESVSLPIEKVEVVVGGLVHEESSVGGALSASGSTQLSVEDSTWVALRVRGSYRGNPDEIAAHTSAVQLLVGDQPLFSAPDAMLVLDQIEGALAYVDTLAPRPEADRFRRLRASLEAAHNRLHQRMHQMGVFHHHTPLHNHEQHKEE